jgi:hypothetical protein
MGAGAETDGASRTYRAGDVDAFLFDDSGAWTLGVFGAGMEGFDDGGDAAAGAEVADNFGPDGVAGFDDVVEDLIDDVFLKDAEVAIGEEIFLEGLELKAGFAGHVADGDATEVGQSGLGADGGELGVIDEDLVGFKLVAPGFDAREGGIEAGLGVIVGVAGGVGGHSSILPSNTPRRLFRVLLSRAVETCLLRADDRLP